jgi:GntR family transcriptional regulator
MREGGQMADPMWRQIAEDLRVKIESGKLGSGGKPLPSELELRDIYSASRNTIRDAVKWLVTRGLVVTRPGHGTFVVKIDPFVTKLSTDYGAGPNAEELAYLSETTARKRIPVVETPRIEIQRASDLIAAELQLDEGTSVLSRHQERFIDGTPWSLQTSFYPMEFIEKAPRLIQAENIAEGVVAYIEQALGRKQVGWRDRFTVRAPDSFESLFFSLPDDGRIAVIEIIRTGFDEDGSPFRVTVATYPADRNQFVLDVGQVPSEDLPSAGEEGAESG